MVMYNKPGGNYYKSGEGRAHCQLRLRQIQEKMKSGHKREEFQIIPGAKSEDLDSLISVNININWVLLLIIIGIVIAFAI